MTNTGQGSAASFTTGSNAPPFTVSSSTEVTNLDAGQLDGDSSANFWQLGGNTLTDPSKQYLGTANNDPLNLGSEGETIMTIGQGVAAIGTSANPADPELSVAPINGDYQDAISGTSPHGNGVDGSSTSGNGIDGTSSSGDGVAGTSVGGDGVDGESTGGSGVYGTSTSADGVLGTSQEGNGVGGSSASGSGLSGASKTGQGVTGVSLSGDGVRGETNCAGTCVCKGNAAVDGCAGSDEYGDATEFGVIGEIDYPPAQHGTASAIEAINSSYGDLFLGIGNSGAVARIDGNGRGYFDGGTENGGADYADAVRAAAGARLRPGDVLAIDPAQPGTVALARSSDAELLAGVYSTRPAVLGTGTAHSLGSLAGRVPVALVGVVPTWVDTEGGPVKVGDLLTVSSRPGYATKAKPVVVDGVDVYPTGTIVGKAMQPLRSGSGLIEVLVTLR